MVVGIIEISVLILAAVAAFLLYKVLKTATSLAINAVLGILSLIVVKFLLGLEIAITWVAVLVCAIGGIFGALVIIVLNYLKIAFI
ncbi:pro-sigmaK processing inhibitor BofA family protein [Methanosarcina mazei]|uniref:pro-sigmaK processing inhibitor BofA family protein n=1 Tax=Methanosarcina mazei TaxID=2209 RepID=UPI002552AC8A|nr:pro-sigmaK processing inhibitor BofA family protein [Methanosarcina mazei]WIM45162.1 pro-sigmaK processing inhibitor BofA family protein [Methanosarcina mazei]